MIDPNNPTHPTPIQLIRIADIHRERRPWHTRLHVCQQDLRALVRALASTQRLTPIRVVRRPTGGYDYVSGLYRLLAAEALGHETIPAFVEDHTDEEFLLRSAFADQEIRFPMTTLERGWTLARLQRLRADRGLPARQIDLVEELRIDKGDVSTALRAARTIPVDRAENLELSHGIPAGAVATLARAPLRLISRAETGEEEERLLKAACSALALGECPTRAVREAHSDPAIADGNRPPHLRVVDWLGRAIRRPLTQILEWVKFVIRNLGRPAE